jgi:hypothetical protein
VTHPAPERTATLRRVPASIRTVAALVLLTASCVARTFSVVAPAPDDLAERREAIADWVVARGYGLEVGTTPEGLASTAWATDPERRHGSRYTLHARRQAGGFEDALTVTLESRPGSDAPRLSVEATTWQVADAVRVAQAKVSAGARADAQALVDAFRTR